ncbi:MAG TPA: Mur ligase domain-containing protein, partial [Caulobacteraceae bacterium]|nr:Mur ligase domain-containing protein [Caulobacteraceae bacterium]
MKARLSDLVQKDLPVDPVISGVTADSRKVRPGFLFAALPGAKTDGKAFAPQAVASGAAAVLSAVEIPGLAAPVVRANDP